MAIMRVLVIVSRDLEKGSTKYRIAQYEEFLRAQGIRLEFVRRAELTGSLVRRSGEFDAVFNQKCLIEGSLSRRLFAESRRVIFDFDDAIYTRPGRPHSFITALRVKSRFRLWLKGASVVTAANTYLANSAKRYASAVEVVPMAIDATAWTPATETRSDGITIGWAGSPATITNVERLNRVLAAVVKKYPSVRVAVFSGARPRLSFPFEYHPFQPGEEPLFVRGLDIGLLPLPDEEYARGKSPIKALQYLACGVPVVGNVVGATAEILSAENSIAVSTDDEWFTALKTLIHECETRSALGRAGRAFVVQHHDVRVIRELLLRLLRGVEVAPSSGAVQ